MKRLIFLMIMTVMIVTTEVKATGLSAYLPLGKNYLDEENMTITSNTMSSNDPFKVKGDTFYTLTLPGTDMLSSDVFIQIAGSATYLDDYILDVDNCVVELQDVHCTFKTAPTENLISLYIATNGILNYYNYYGFYNFQLEEGMDSTNYEAYIAPFVDSTEPEFQGSGAYIGSYLDNMSLSQIIDEHIVVTDEIDGNLNSRITINTDEYTTHETEVGEYDVVISACDNSNNCSFFNLLIVIKDEIPPVITGPSRVEVSATSPNNSYNLITSNFSYFDEYDPSCQLTIVRDDYSTHNQVIGSYVIEFIVTDGSGNTAFKSFVVDVVDKGAPVISGNTVYVSPLSNKITISNIINQLQITDNIDSIDNLLIMVKNDTYTSNINTVGNYTFTVEVTDSSNNTSVLGITVQVIDDIAPNLSGPETYSYSYTNKLSINDFKSMLSVSDNYDIMSINNIYVVSDTFSNRGSEIGNYQITFGVKDNSLNETIHTISITIFDNIAPVIYVDSFIVTVNLSSTFKEEDAIKLLIASNELDTGEYLSMSLIDEYSGNENKVGSYIQRYLFTNAKGQEFEKEFIIQVVGEEQTEWNSNLLLRNLIIYPIVLGLVVIIFIKKKK